MKYVKRMSKLRDDFEESVDDFMDHYDTVIKQAVNNLQGLYEEGDYPTKEQVRKRFRMDINITPIPASGDFRIDINEKELNKLRTKLDEQLIAAQEAAEQDLFSRLYTSVAKAVITLRAPEKIFRNTLILNIEEISKSIPDMNINNNHQLDGLANDLLKITVPIDLKALRNDYDYRIEVAKQLADTLERIEAIYLGANNEPVNASTNDDESTQSTAA